MKLLKNAALLLVVLAFVACAPAAEEAVVEVPDTTEADREAIIAQIEGWEAALTTDDTDAFVALYEEGAVLMPPNAPSITGGEAIRTVTGGLFDEATIVLDTVVYDELVIAGDWAFARDSYEVTSIPKAGGEEVQESLKSIRIWRRQADSSWKIARHIWNANEPPPEQ